MKTPLFTRGKNGFGYHMLMACNSGRGKSALLQAEATRRGITYEELLKQTEPTVEENEQQQLRHDEDHRADERRLGAVREAYWSNISAGDDDLEQLYDVLAMADIVKEPTAEQVKAFFMMFPADIIGSALEWGFSDAAVGERTYEFVMQNKQAVLDRVNAVK